METIVPDMLSWMYFLGHSHIQPLDEIDSIYVMLPVACLSSNTCCLQ